MFSISLFRVLVIGDMLVTSTTVIMGVVLIYDKAKKKKKRKGFDLLINKVFIPVNLFSFTPSLS